GARIEKRGVTRCHRCHRSTVWCAIGFDMSASFGRGRPRRKTRPFIEDVPRIFVGDVACALSAASHARARATTIHAVINGKPEVLDVVHEPCNYGGNGRPFFLCGTCSKKVLHLYLLGDGDRRDGKRLACRRCSGVVYASQHTRRRGINRARRLRARIGALPSVLAPLPSRPPHWRRDYWLKRLVELARAEGALAAELHAIVPRVRQRLKHDRQHRNRAI